MCDFVVLGIWENTSLHRIKVENLNLDAKAEILKNEALKSLNGQMNNIELSYCGHMLESENSLSSYGIKSGSIVYVLERKQPLEEPVRHKLNESEVRDLVNSFKSFKISRLSQGFRTALQRLTRPEALENIIATTPGLVNDPIALAIIQDPELVIQMTQPECVAEVAERHPALIEAAHYMAAHIHDEQANLTRNQASTSTGYSYSLEALSDDEDEDDLSPELAQEAAPIQRNSSFNAITAAQLAAAIANATNTTFNTNSAGVPNASSNGQGGGNVITSEMFRNAIQQAFGSAPGSGTNSTQQLAPSASVSESETGEPVMVRYQAQLRQMHELGLTNDATNVRALQASSGDVQAAIELVFNGVVD